MTSKQPMQADRDGEEAGRDGVSNPPTDGESSGAAYPNPRRRGCFRRDGEEPIRVQRPASRVACQLSDAGGAQDFAWPGPREKP
jgi:hypothetical protein